MLKDYIKVQGRRKRVIVLCLRPQQNVKLGSFTLKSCTTAKKCSRKGDVRAKLLFCQTKPIAFLPLSLTSPSSLPKLSNATGSNGESSEEDCAAEGQHGALLCCYLDNTSPLKISTSVEFNVSLPVINREVF